MTPKQQVNSIRRAIRTCGKTPYRVAKDAGVSPAVVYRFLSGERDVTLATLDKIAAGASVELYLEKA